jgi:hypothetical protein
MESEAIPDSDVPRDDAWLKMTILHRCMWHAREEGKVGHIGPIDAASRKHGSGREKAQ